MNTIVVKILHILCGFKGYLSSKKIHGEYFLCNRGIGDTVFFLSLLKEYYELNKKKEQINIIIPINQKPVADAYSKYINQVIIVKKKTLKNMIHAANNNLLPQNIKFILPKGSMEFLGYKGLSIWDLQCITLNLPEIGSYVKPQFTDSAELKQIYRKYHSFHKILIIAPFAVSVSGINSDLWKRVVRIYKKNGYEIFTNTSTSKELPIEDTTKLKVGIDTIFNMCENGAEFIGLRSGLCDLLAFSICKMTVIYPDDSVMTLMSKYTFENMPFNKTIVELKEREAEDYFCENFI